MKLRLLTPLTSLASLMVIAACCGHAAMSQELKTEDRQEFLDRIYPFLEPGQEPEFPFLAKPYRPGELGRRVSELLKPVPAQL